MLLMTHPESQTPEYVQPQWNHHTPSAELEPVSRLRTNPATLDEKFSIESPKNIYRIREALPDFAKIYTKPLDMRGTSLYMSEGDGNTYIVELPANEKSLIEEARRCAWTDPHRTSIFPEREKFGDAALLAGMGSAIGGIAGGLIQNGQKLFESIMRGEFYDRNTALSDYSNIGAMIGTTPGTIYLGVLGFNAVSGVVKRVSANTSALVADLHDIAQRREKQVIALDNTPRTIELDPAEPNTTVEIRAGKFVSDFLHDLSPSAIQYAWENGLSDILRDIQAKQTEFKDLSIKARYFKVNDTAAQGIADALVGERGRTLDEALRNLVTFREEVLPEAIRLSLEQGKQQDLR